MFSRVLVITLSLVASFASATTLSRRASSDKFLSAHNAIRAEHGAADLLWSEKLAAMATTWAEGCNFSNTGGSLTSDFVYGELIIAGTGLKIQDAVNHWASDKGASFCIYSVLP